MTSLSVAGLGRPDKSHDQTIAREVAEQLTPRVRWAETIASLLAPGGVFYFTDAHPAMLVL